MSASAAEVRQLVGAVSRSIPLDELDLPDEFYPAHLSVALIDAVFGSRLQNGERAVPAAERYCRYFGISRTRAEPWELPPKDEQEGLKDLLERFDALGVDRMTDEVFQTRQLFAGTKIARTECVRRAAGVLRRIGVDTLQDFATRRAQEIEHALRLPPPAMDENAVRMLLMYASNDDFVRGDAHVRNFVARATGRTTVSPATAEDLVRQCAYELILSPRYLDFEIWRRGLAR